MSDQFRSNAFGEKIAQPGATYADIENILLDRYMPDILTLQSADLFTEGDALFKFGGTLYFTFQIEGPGDIVDYNDASIEFDGFETAEVAREWVIALGVVPSMINEVA